MEQVLQNIIFNARDAMGSGNIWIRTREDEFYVVIEIEDEGPGIPVDEQEKVFNAFYTTKDHGTGLGLGICRRIVVEHQGKLKLNSPVRNGKGTCFTLSLPKEKLLGDPTVELDEEAHPVVNAAALKNLPPLLEKTSFPTEAQVHAQDNDQKEQTS
jgi:K+-sensing histidine kinase KdpD